MKSDSGEYWILEGEKFLVADLKQKEKVWLSS